MFEIYTVLPDGTGNTKVSGTLAADGDVQFISPWAPDSSRIAYRADQDTDNVNELYMSTADGVANAKISGTLVAGGNVTSFAMSP